MKKFTFIFCLIVSQNFLFAQTYHTLPDSNAKWIYKEWTSVFTYNYITFQTAGDTIINSKKYTKLFNGDPYRSDNTGKTWVVPYDSTQEYLLMDVSKNPGDTVHNIYCGGCNSLFYVIIDSIRYINVGPYLLKVIYYMAYIPPSVVYPGEWIEKIGIELGFYNWSFGNPNPTHLYCMSFNDTIYYPFSYTYGTCSTSVDVEENNNLIDKITTFPNPFTNSFKLLFSNQLPNYEYVLTIYNLLGMVCKSIHLVPTTETEIACDEFPSGLYLIMISNNENNFIITKRIIKE